MKHQNSISSPDLNINQNFNSLPNSYTWIGVLEFLQDQYRSINYKETEWLLEKQQLEGKIAKLEGELQAHETINKDLIKRIKMLEFSLRQERINSSKSPNTPALKDAVSQFFNEGTEFSLNNALANNETNNISFPKRKARSHRPLLAKFLEEIGFDDIFSSLNDQENNNKSLNYSNISNNKNENMQDFEKNLNSTPKTHKEPFFGGQNEISQPQKKPSSRDLTPTTKQKMNAILDKSPQNNLSIHEKISKKMEESSKTPIFKTNYEVKCSLKSHLDGVRDVFFYNNEEVLVSVSEDCLIKLWDMKALDNFKENTLIEPYFTLREHTGPLFTLAGSVPEDKPNLVFSAGSEGIIKSWAIPLPNEIDNYGIIENRNFCNGNWAAHEEAIWELKYHPFDKTLLSSGADSQIKMWKIVEDYDQETKQKYYNGVLANKFIHGIGPNSVDVPTSLTWIHTSLNKFASGFMNSPNLVVFDKETGKQLNVMHFKLENQKIFQANKVVSHKNLNFLVSGHEDKQIRFFDLNSNRMIKSIVAHKESINSLSFQSNGFSLSSVSHDNSLKIWDIRKYECIYEINDCHYSKYDETIHVVSNSDVKNILATGGADGIIKLYSLK